MNILFTSYYFPPDARGGAEISAYTVGRELVGAGHEVHVLTRDAGAAYDDIFIVHDEIRSSELPKELVAASTKKHVNRLLDDHNFDLVHVQNEYTAAGALQACKNTDVPCIVSVRDYWLLDPLRLCYDFTPGTFSDETHLFHLLKRGWNKFRYDGAPKKWLSPAITLYLERFRRFERSGIDQADMLLTNSEFMQRKHAEVHPDVRTVYNSIDTSAFRPIKTPENDETRILFIGRFRPEKGIETLLKAMKQVVDERDNIVLDIVGTETPPPWAASLIEELNLTDHIRFHGRAPFSRLPEVYNKADLVVFPSEWCEPFGRISIEAMACGTPVIATDVGGIPEVVTDETGVLVPPGDANVLAAAINGLVDDPARREQVGKAGRERVETYFAPDVVAKQQLEAYEAVV